MQGAMRAHKRGNQTVPSRGNCVSRRGERGESKKKKGKVGDRRGERGESKKKKGKVGDRRGGPSESYHHKPLSCPLPDTHSFYS